VTDTSKGPGRQAATSITTKDRVRESAVLSGLEQELTAALAEVVAADAALDADARPADAHDEAMQILAEALARSAADPRACALALLARRQAGELLGHILGRVRFLDCELLTAPDCLVPRKETEVLGRLAIELLQARSALSGEPLRCIDMCCGAGNLACAIAHHVPSVRVWASDLTDGCVNLARRNVEHLGLGERVTVRQGDLFAPLAELGLEGQVDLVVCNPPYISTGRLAGDRAGLLQREPREAFEGGPYGLSIHQRVLRDAPSYLRRGGWLAFEIGAGQERQLELLIQRSRGVYGPVRWELDPSSGKPRAPVLQRT
jgi:release factor glutamine methyltransferase